MLCDPGPTSPEPGAGESQDNATLTVQDINLLCDLFYLPCEHGPKVNKIYKTRKLFFDHFDLRQQGIELLTEFYWLKTNAVVMLSGDEKPETPCEVLVEYYSIL